MISKKQTADEVLQFMNDVLDKLIDNAEKLNELSVQKIAEEELIALQEVQERLFNELLEADETLNNEYPETKQLPFTKVHQEVNKKLDTFQELNQTFIENLKATHGIIQFENEPPKKPKPHKH